MIASSSPWPPESGRADPVAALRPGAHEVFGVQGEEPFGAGLPRGSSVERVVDGPSQDSGLGSVPQGLLVLALGERDGLSPG